MWKRLFMFKRLLSTVHTLKRHNNGWCSGMGFVPSGDYRMCAYLLDTRRNIASKELKTEEKVAKIRLEKRLLLLESDIKRVNKVYRADVEHILHDIQTEDLAGGVLLLRCCGSLLPDEVPSARVQLVHSVWDALQTLGTDFTVEHYNALLGSYIENKQQISAKDLLSKMGPDLPNEATYQLLLTCVCETGDVDQAAQVLKWMKARSHPASEAVFNTLVLGHARARDMKSAHAVLEMMRTAQLALSSNTYSALLQGYAVLGDLPMLFETLKEAAGAGIQLSEKQFMEVVNSLAVSGHEELIIKILPAGKFELTPELNNTVVQLVHLGYEYAAFLLLSVVSVPRQEPTTFCTFFIQEMVKANRPIASVLVICDALIANGCHARALSEATRFALLLARTDMALALLRAMKEHDIPLRTHFFWPLFLAVANYDGEKGVFMILEQMREMGVAMDYDTLVYYVLPHASLAEPQFLLRKLQASGLAVTELLSPIVVALLRARQTKAALELCKAHRGQIDPAKLIPVLVKTFLVTKDLGSCVGIVQEMIASSARQDEDWPGQFLLGVLTSRNARAEPQLIESCIKKFKHEALRISTFVGDVVALHLTRSSLSGDEKTSIEDALSTIMTSERSMSTSQVFGPLISHPRNMSVEDLECHLIELKAKNLNTRGVLRRLLQRYCQQRNVKGALHIKQEFEAAGFQFSAGMQASLFDLYIQIGDLDEAESCLLELSKRAPGFVVDEHKVVDFAALLVNNNKYKVAVATLKKHAGEQPVRGGDGIARNCWRLLQAVAERGEPAMARHMLEVLLTLGYCSLSNALLGPLVRAHLINGSLLGAVREYKRCVIEYRQTPLQYELLCRLVQEVGSSRVKEAQQLLQEVLDATQIIHGVDSAHVALAVALAETREIKQLHCMLTDSNVILEPSLLLTRCKRLADEDKLEALETLAEACKGSIYIAELFILMLQVHSRRGNCEGALGLWIRMQDLNIQPSARFLNTLASLLQSHKQKVPFCIPSGQSQESEVDK